MSVQLYELELTWPITDPEQSLGQLRATAHADLRATLAARGLTASGNPLWRVTHGQTPEITVRLLVTTPAGIRLPAHDIEATEAPTADDTQGADAA